MRASNSARSMLDAESTTAQNCRAITPKRLATSALVSGALIHQIVVDVTSRFHSLTMLVLTAGMGNVGLYVRRHNPSE
jgi:hypothetical protein